MISHPLPALEVLESKLPARGESSYKRGLGAGLALLGSKKGIAILIEVLADGGERDRWQRHSAAESLNTIAGQRIYKGSFGGADMQASGNFDEALKWFQDWWKNHEAELTFDRETGRWKQP